MANQKVKLKIIMKEPIKGNELKTKMLTCAYFLTDNYGWESLETKIERFVNSEPMDIIDIQFSSVNFRQDATFGYCAQSYMIRSALIIYKPQEIANSKA